MPQAQDLTALENQLPCQEEIDEISSYLDTTGISMLDEKFQEIQELIVFWKSILTVLQESN